MTALAKIEANRHNALASTGPKTTEGRAIVSGNAIRHGLLSWKPVIPGLEHDEDWEAHLERTLESLAPVGYAENLLAERAALLLWRIGRVARYEREATAIAIEQAEARQRPKLDDAEQSIGAAQRVAGLAEGLRTLPPEVELHSEAAVKVLSKAAVEANVDLYEDEEIAWPSYLRGALDEVDWTASRLVECLEIVAQRGSITMDELIAETWQALCKKVKDAQQKRDELLAESDRERRGLLLPDALTMEKVNRYETTLERSLYKALHELERRQAARDGQAVPLPVAIDVTLSGPHQE